MAATINFTSGDIGLRSNVVAGLIVSDATAAPTYLVTGSANQKLDLTVNDNTGMLSGNYIQIDGSGTAGANYWYLIRYVGVYAVGGTTKFTVEDNNSFLGRGLVTAVTNANAKQFYAVHTRFTPKRARLKNLSTGEEFEWFAGMACNSAIKTATSGAVTLLSSGGIIVDAKGFYVHPDLVPVNNNLSFEAFI